jgi:WD40 repeat protein
VATGSDDGFLRLWSVPGGALLREIRLPNRRLAGLRFSPDGSRLAVAGVEKQVHFFDTRDFTPLGRLPGHPGGLRALCFSPDGSRLFTVGFDGAISQWNVSTGNLEKTTTVDNAQPRAVAVTPNGEKFAMAIGESIQIRLVADWSVLHELKGHTKIVTDLAFSPDGKSLASGSNDRDIILWDTDTAEKKQVLQGHQSPVSSLQFSTDGTRLISSGFDRTIRLWDPASGREILTLGSHRGSIRQALFSPDGQWIASAGDDNRVLLWDGSARMEEYKVRQFKSLSDLAEMVDAHNRLESENSTNTMNLPELLGPTQQKGWAISRDGPDYIILDRHARAARLAREQSLLQSWK